MSRLCPVQGFPHSVGAITQDGFPLPSSASARMHFEVHEGMDLMKEKMLLRFPPGR